jgi:hypothetical protein
MLKTDDEIINLVNAGHHRGASQVWRLVGDNHEPKSFDVWGAKCFAGISLEIPTDNGATCIHWVRAYLH